MFVTSILFPPVHWMPSTTSTKVLSWPRRVLSPTESATSSDQAGYADAVVDARELEVRISEVNARVHHRDLHAPAMTQLHWPASLCIGAPQP